MLDAMSRICRWDDIERGEGEEEDDEGEDGGGDDDDDDDDDDELVE